MKYKVGDKVRVRSDLEVNECYGAERFIQPMEHLKGQMVTIRSVYENIYDIKNNGWYWTDEMFEDMEVLYTYPEILMMEELPEKILNVEDGYIFYTKNNRYFDMEGLNITLGTNFCTDKRLCRCFKILEEEILTEKEKEFLSNVLIDRDEIEYIKKCSYIGGTTGHIRVVYITGDSTAFKNFKLDKHYKNMETQKKYTLEELGL